uniref:Dynein light chain n=1 Tax=Phasianus colchicus TaxID=9054 RepID=A0A669PJH2_PHACC
MGEQKAVIKDTDMPEEMQQQAVQCALRSLEEHSPECNVAAHIKRVNVTKPAPRPAPLRKVTPSPPLLQEFDRRYTPTWHCVVGRNFSSCVTHETNHFIFAYLGHVALLLFKSA